MNKISKVLSALISALFISNSYAGVTVIDFDTATNGNNPNIIHGRIIDNEYKNIGVNITSVNVNDTSDTSDDIVNLQVAFDTDRTNTADSDLEFYNRTTPKTQKYNYTALEIDGINFGATPGNVLIMQNADYAQKSPGTLYNDLANNECNEWICKTPDDENGTDPAGYFEFTFDTLVDIISLDTFDIEDNGEFVIQFFVDDTLVETLVETDKLNNDTVEIFGADDFEVTDATNQAKLQTMQNEEFVRQVLNVVGINRLRIQIPGSGAIDNLAFRTQDVPVPATLGIFALALLFIARRAKN